MIKICHMTSAHPPEDERIFFKEAVSLATHGYDTYLVEHGSSYDKYGVHIVGVGEFPTSRLKRMTEGAKRVYEAALALDADIYHFHDPELLPYGLKLKKAGKKVIFDSHENTVEQINEKEWIPGWIRRPMYCAFDWYQKHVCRQLDAVISVTPHICAYFQAFQPRTRMITNYPILQQIPEHVLRDLNSVFFAGTISPLYHHETMIQIFDKIPNSRYILCGGGPEEYIRELQQLSGWSHVTFPGKIPHEEVFPLSCTGNIGLTIVEYTKNGNGKEGTLGNVKLFEQMMAGLAVICTDFDLWIDIIDRYHCGICVDPADVDAIAAAIRYLLDHPEEARQMGENGRRAVKEEFNWGVEEKKLLSLYEDILKD